MTLRIIYKGVYEVYTDVWHEWSVKDIRSNGTLLATKIMGAWIKANGNVAHERVAEYYERANLKD